MLVASLSLCLSTFVLPICLARGATQRSRSRSRTCFVSLYIDVVPVDISVLSEGAAGRGGLSETGSCWLEYARDSCVAVSIGSVTPLLTRLRGPAASAFSKMEVWFLWNHRILSQWHPGDLLGTPPFYSWGTFTLDVVVQQNLAKGTRWLSGGVEPAPGPELRDIVLLVKRPNLFE